jgi:CRP-like cAMP-binding protein
MPLPESAVAALERLQASRRTVPRNASLAVQGQRIDKVHVLVGGTAIRFRLLPDGRRQIINFVLPGDFFGLRGCFFEKYLNSVLALETSEVASFEPATLIEVLGEHPALGAAVFWTTAMDQMILNERIVAIGRRSAHERLAHLFLTLFERMQLIGLADERSYTLPLNLEILADTLGLSVVHVSRMLSRLRAEGLVTLKDGTVTIHDREGLAAISDFEIGSLARYQPSTFSVTTFRAEPNAAPDGVHGQKT